jgi:molecular chaperone HtpG
VIDSSDLPLNVSRELLQGSRAIASIHSNAVKRVLRLLTEMAVARPAACRAADSSGRHHRSTGEG